MRISVALTIMIAVAVGGCAFIKPKGPSPDHILLARELSQRGLLATRQEEWKKAEDLFHQATKANVNDAKAHQHYAESLWQRGAKAQAVASMTNAARLSKGDPKILVRLGEMYLDQNRLSAAKSCAKLAIQADPKLAAAWAIQGDVLRRQKRLDDALASYHRALCYQEHFPRIQIEIAKLYHQQNRPWRALATIQSVADQYVKGEEPAQVLYLEGLTLTTLDRFDEATRQLALASKRDPSNPEILYQLGRAELLAGHPASAEIAAKQALALAPNHRPSRDMLTKIKSSPIRTVSGVER